MKSRKEWRDLLKWNFANKKRLKIINVCQHLTKPPPSKTFKLCLAIWVRPPFLKMVAIVYDIMLLAKVAKNINMFISHVRNKTWCWFHAQSGTIGFSGVRQQALPVVWKRRKQNRYVYILYAQRSFLAQMGTKKTTTFIHNIVQPLC